MKSKKKIRGKCPKCQTVNISTTKTFKCRNCGHELQLRGKNAAKERRLFALSFDESRGEKDFPALVLQLEFSEPAEIQLPRQLVENLSYAGVLLELETHRNDDV